MQKNFRLIAVLCCLLPTPAFAEEPWTDLGIYLFMADLDGESRLGNVTSDIDVPFSDILKNLDFGYMGYIEHRRDRWSFIGDIAYLRLTDEKTSASDGALVVELDIELEQSILEGFVGYRVLERGPDVTGLDLDILVGARHTRLEIDLGSEAKLLGLGSSRSRSGDEDWTDTVVGLRLQFGDRKGWGGTLWADVGDGSDSSSEQFMALASYRGDSAWQFFGGYRFLNLEFDKGSKSRGFGIDIDYSGPMFGASYRL